MGRKKKRWRSLQTDHDNGDSFSSPGSAALHPYFLLAGIHRRVLERDLSLEGDVSSD